MLKNRRIWFVVAGILIILSFLVVVFGRLHVIPLFHTLKPVTASSYTKVNCQGADAGNYSVVVTNPYGSVTSANAALTVNLPPSITTQPQSQTVAPGANACTETTSCRAWVRAATAAIGKFSSASKSAYSGGAREHLFRA